MELDAALVSLNKAAAGPANKVGGTGSSSAAPAANAGNQAGKKKKYVLNASDKLFSQLRDQNFAVVGGMLLYYIFSSFLSLSIFSLPRSTYSKLRN